MVIINEKDYIGKGGFQKCYIHPNNPNLCLKIRLKRTNKDPRVNREIKYYKKIQKNKALPFIAKYHGELNTNMGVASVYDLVRDETTNKIALTLHDYLKMENSLFTDEMFLAALNTLKTKLIKHKIIVRDLMGKNICCKIRKNNAVELVIVDGVGHRDFIPLVDWFSYFTKRKMDKIFIKKKLYSMREHKKWVSFKYSN